jgi:hypothetical protein
LADSRFVVRTFTGDLAFTFRASFKTRWLRRVPVLRGLVRFLGLPMGTFPFRYITTLETNSSETGVFSQEEKVLNISLNTLTNDKV